MAITLLENPFDFQLTQVSIFSLGLTTQARCKRSVALKSIFGSQLAEMTRVSQLDVACMHAWMEAISRRCRCHQVFDWL